MSNPSEYKDRIKELETSAKRYADEIVKYQDLMNKALDEMSATKLDALKANMPYK